MKLAHMIGAGFLMMVGGMVLAWSLDDSKAEAKIAANYDDNFSSEDAAAAGLTPAMLAARSTFDAFWTRVSKDKTGLDAIGIKIGIPHDKGMEHLWMTGCKSDDAQVFDCVLSNKPNHVSFIMGTRYRFSRQSISDWMYRENGKINGGYSIREQLPNLPKKQAEDMSAMLAPLPQ